MAAITRKAAAATATADDTMGIVLETEVELATEGRCGERLLFILKKNKGLCCHS